MTDTAKLRIEVESSQAKRATAELGSLERQSRQTETATQRMARENQRAAQSFGGVTNAAKALAGALSALAFGQALRGIINITDQYTQLESRLRLVTDSAQELAQVQNELNNIAARTRGSVTGLTDLYIRLGQAGGELGANQEQLLRFTEGVSNALVLSGASAQSASGALIQLSQALGGGVVRAEEFNSILEGAPEIIRIVAREMDGMGGSISALRRAVNSGSVSSAEFFQAFLEGSQETSEAAQQMERTVGNAAQGFRNTLGAAIAETDMSGLVDSIDDLSDTLNDPAVRQGLESVASGIVNIANAATKAISWLGKLGTAIGETAGEFALQFDEMNALEKAFVAINPLARAYALQQAANTRNSKAAREEAEKGVRGVIDYVDGLTKLEGQADLTGKAFFEWGKGAEQAGVATEVLNGQVQAQIEAMRRVNELIGQGVERGVAETRVKLELAGATASQITEYLALQGAISAAAKDTETLSTAEADRIADLQASIALNERIIALVGDGRTVEEARWVAAYEGADEYNRKLMIQEKQLEGIADAQAAAARATEEAAEAAKRAIEQAIQEAQRMRDELNRGITDGLLRGFEAGKGFAKNFIDVLKAQFQSLVLRPTISFIVSGIQGAASQIGGAAFSSLTGGGGIAGLLGGAGGIGAAIFNGTLPLIDAIGNTFPTLATSLTKLSASLTALSPGMLALGAAGAAGLFAVGRGLAVDNSRVGENVQGAAAVLNPLSLVASGLDRITGGGAFGTKFRTVGQELTLSVEDGVIESMLWVTQSRKRSGYRGRKWRAWSEEFNTEIFQAAFDSLAETAGQAARLAGTGLDLSATIQRDIFRDENGAQLAFDDLATVIAERIVPGIRDFSREGETVANTFARITAQAQGLDAGLMGLNTSLSGVALFEQAERLSQVFGDQLSGSMSSLQSVLLTSEQQFENLRTVLSGALGEVGVALTDSRENLLGVVQGLDLTTESGIRAYEVLLAAAPQLGAFFTELERQATELERQADAAFDARQAFGIAASDMILAFESIGQELPATRAELLNMVQGLNDAELLAIAPFTSELLRMTDVAQTAAESLATAAESLEQANRSAERADELAARRARVDLQSEFAERIRESNIQAEQAARDSQAAALAIGDSATAYAEALNIALGEIRNSGVSGGAGAIAGMIGQRNNELLFRTRQQLVNNAISAPSDLTDLGPLERVRRLFDSGELIANMSGLIVQFRQFGGEIPGLTGRLDLFFGDLSRAAENLAAVSGNVTAAVDGTSTALQRLTNIVASVDAAAARGNTSDVADLIADAATRAQQVIAARADEVLQAAVTASVGINDVAALDAALVQMFDLLAKGRIDAAQFESAFDLAVGQFQGLTDAVEAVADAVRSADDILRERLGLERQLLELQGNTAELRRRERDALDESNRALFDQVNALRDARQSFEQFSAISGRIGEFVRELRGQLSGDSGLSQARARFEDISRRAALGDLSALESLVGSGSEYVGLLRDSALGQEEFARELARVTRLSEAAQGVADRQGSIAQQQLDRLGVINDSVLEVASGIRELQPMAPIVSGVSVQTAANDESTANEIRSLKDTIQQQAADIRNIRQTNDQMAVILRRVTADDPERLAVATGP